VATSERADRVAPVLVFACGNPSRGDDALGPRFVERIADLLGDAVGRGTLELLTDFQLQVEHALDLVGRAQVVFVDASVSCTAPFAWTGAAPARDGTFSTHAMSPAAVLATYREITGDDPPPCHILGIRGYGFDLGEPLSTAAAAHLDAAVAFFGEWLGGLADDGGIRR
jgi:hydrogenase maturation protease